jgi:tetratricopeptide (TPR) repeat protein
MTMNFPRIPALALMIGTAFCAEEPPSVEEAIPGPVKSLAAPAGDGLPGGFQIAVSSDSEAAQRHVNLGLDHLNAGWEFEASRHFGAALMADPDCLLAHWGMLLCLIDPGPETVAARDAAMERLLALVEAGAGSELERGYAYGLIKYIQDGPEGAEAAFRKVSARFPNEIQAAVLAALFGRGGFDAEGDATPGQERAEKVLHAMIQKHRGSPVPIHALLFIRAEGRITPEFLVMARFLAVNWPGYAPYQHMLGHYEWRSGNHALAAEAFASAAQLYQEWMKSNGVAAADCPEWLKASAYRVLALMSMGETKAATGAADDLAAIPWIADRPASAGNRFLMWEARTLPARILIRHNEPGMARKAAASLPKPEDLVAFRKHSLAYWWIDGLRILCESRGLLDEGKIEAAREVMAALAHHMDNMAENRDLARAGGELSQWSRAFRAMEILMSELRADLALAGEKSLRGPAYNWLSAAADRQSPAALLMPPAVLAPASGRLGDLLMAEDKPAEAIEAYQHALVLFPNDLQLLGSLEQACRKAGRDEDAADAARRIEKLKTGE